MKRFLIIITLILILGTVGAVVWGYRNLRTPVHHGQSGQYIEIPKGTSPAAVIKKLTAAGIIGHEKPVLMYMKVTGVGQRFKAGEYDFPSPITPYAVLAKLQTGEQRLIRLTVLEGWTRWDIANAMARLPELKLSDPNSALALMDDVTLIQDLDPLAKNLEGYLFQTEAKLETERPIIASVIYNRLKVNMALGIDSTVIYASKLEGKWRNDGKVYKSDIDRRSPYNTRLYAGLPPGPIASSGESALTSVINPAQTDYLYYVREPSRDDGAHNFYNNETDFFTGVQALRRWEQERDLENARKKAAESNTN
ncbi:MAG: endolytic transglycosylase MltG [Acidobacteria bacterium]|nr:endolytic transglycosylase MltG [Acidobacteriota bacterium]